MKKFTFILTSMLFLLVGGVFSQEVTPLYLNNGGNWEATNGAQKWRDYDHNVTCTSGVVTFNSNSFNGKNNGLTGTNWVADLNAGETHIFTITLNSGAPAGFHFYIAADRYGDFNNGNARKYVNATIPEGETSVSYSIDATTYPDLLKPAGDNVGPYKYVYIVNEGTQGAKLDIASITRTITTAPFVALNESSDNLIPSEINHVVVELTRSFVKDTWNTVCLPFALTSAQATQLFGSGYKLAQFTSVSGTTMKFTTAANFEAGVPYLVLPKEGCATGTTVLFDVNITAKNPTPVPIDNYTFTGTFTTKKFTSPGNTTSRFVATGNELMTPEEDTTLKSLRCYFTVSPTAPARSLSFDVDEEGGTTSINTVQGSGVMVNGYYNLNGQRVAQPTKGLYIVNGKKVVIK